MNKVTNPRSSLHALEPFGLGTGDLESLLSYFCRLAVSHSTSTLSLSRAIALYFEHEVEAEFDWFHRQLSGIGDAALTWSDALSALTSVPRLDKLTFLPWRNVVSQNGLPIVSKGQFCPHCLAEDLAQDKTPYFRLAWELKAVSVCHKHKCRLGQHCPCCGKDNSRHSAAFVVPGWCTKCGSFLGSASGAVAKDTSAPIKAVELWRARQIHDLVLAQEQFTAAPDRQAWFEAIKHIINEMDGGQSARLARRVGLAKSTVHYWLQSDNKPTLEASLAVALQSGISLHHLLSGNTNEWTAPPQGLKLTPAYFKNQCQRKYRSRNIDWDSVDAHLQKFLLEQPPMSVREVSRRLGVDVRRLYLHDNQTTRQIGQRWLDYLTHRKAAKLKEAMPRLEAAGKEVLMTGKALNLRELISRMAVGEVLSVQGLYYVLKDISTRMSADTPRRVP